MLLYAFSRIIKKVDANNYILEQMYEDGKLTLDEKNDAVYEDIQLEITKREKVFYASCWYLVFRKWAFATCSIQSNRQVANSLLIITTLLSN